MGDGMWQPALTKALSKGRMLTWSGRFWCSARMTASAFAANSGRPVLSLSVMYSICAGQTSHVNFHGRCSCISSATRKIERRPGSTCCVPNSDSTLWLSGLTTGRWLCRSSAWYGMLVGESYAFMRMSPSSSALPRPTFNRVRAVR